VFQGKGTVSECYSSDPTDPCQGVCCVDDLRYCQSFWDGTTATLGVGLTKAECDDLDGTWHGGTGCSGESNYPCPEGGACCTITGTANTEGVEGFCEQTSQATCEANGGTWFAGVPCESAICSCDCADPGYAATCGSSGSVSFIIGKACVLPAHIQVTITTDDTPPVVTVENYYHASGDTFTVSADEGDHVAICVNPDVYFECDPDEGCTETEGGSLTFQECYAGIEDELEPCAQRIRCVDPEGCVQAYDMSAGGYATIGDCEADCVYPMRAQRTPPVKRQRTPRPPKVKSPRPELKKVRAPDPPPGKGPGAELKKLLAKIGIVSKPNCSCNARARAMDDRGADWCAENIPTIVGWLEEEHKRQKIQLPFSKLAASLLVRYAIRCARAITKGEQNA